ncbi:MAG: hypothetical protein E4G91_09950 [Candidatus Zixiibacteriota bacterium]|nr:MAG: hypothetical protein E4G91_09950 [candidate division Zixibacteria bacterium]
MNPALHGAIIAAQKGQQEEEEQRMTQYNAEDLNGWEFKIVRSTFGRFGNAEVIRRLMEEEARNGWEMVEKFDDYRIRFKRRTDKRALHSGGGVDPYRTNYGTSRLLLPLFAVGVALALAVTLFVFKNDSAESSATPYLLFVVFGIMVVLAIVMIVLRRK